MPTAVKYSASRRGKWRRRFGRTFLATPYAAAVLGWFAHVREPMGGELFTPADLTPGWWSVAVKLTLLTMVISGVAWLTVREASGGVPRLDGELEIEDDAIRIRGDEPIDIDRRQVRHVHATADHLSLHLDADREVTLAFDDPAERRRVHERLLEDVSRRRGRASVKAALHHAPPLPGLLWFVFAMTFLTALVSIRQFGEAFAAGNAVGALTATGVMLAIQGAIAWGLKDREVEIGTDGVLRRGRLGRRFIAWDEIEEVEGRPRQNVTLRLRDGRSVHLKVKPQSRGLFEELSRAFRQHRERSHEAPGETPLARGERSVGEWTDALRTGANRYRERALRFEELTDILDDPRQSPEMRVAAGVALSAREGGAERVRIAADTTADPQVEALLEAAAEGEVTERRLQRAQRRYVERAED